MESVQARQNISTDCTVWCTTPYSRTLTTNSIGTRAVETWYCNLGALRREHRR